MDSYGFTKTLMSYRTGELVLYDGKPYLVEDLQVEPLRVVLGKIEGGTKRVKPSFLTQVPQAEGLIFSSIDEIPHEILRPYYPSLITIVGSHSKRVILEEADFSMVDAYIKPLGERAKKLVGEIKKQYPEINFKKGLLKKKIPIVVCKSKPSGKLGILTKYRNSIEKAGSAILIYQSDQECPDGFSANQKLCDKVSLSGCYFFQVRDLNDVPALVTSMILGLASSHPPKRILHIPNP